MNIKVIYINAGIPKAGVVVPVLDFGSELTKDFLKNLCVTTDIPIKVILVESNGPDFSYAKSMNAGFKVCNGSKFVMGLDNDAFPRLHCLDNLLECALKHPELGYIAASAETHYNPYPTVGWSYRSMPAWFFDMVLRGAPFYAFKRILKGQLHPLWLYSPRHPIPGKMIGVPTTAFILRRECYEEIGPFDEGYRVSFTDSDYCFRIMLSDKWYLTCCTEARVYHRPHPERLPDQEMIDAGWKKYTHDWPRERAKLVKEAARNGKFKILDGMRNG